MAVAASASPVLEVRNEPAPAPAPTCSATQTAKCCQNVVSSILDVLGLGIGIGCVDILGDACTAKATCCSSGAQYGLINVDLVCALSNV
ncbi:MAG: hypothetical protein M4579_000724 [Chaenotheca gracillima]|nr:MAG: hypothetical protein M4579_000724 [Chaenotheca gracillima]